MSHKLDKNEICRSGCRFEEKSFDKMHHIYQKCIMLVIYASHLSCNAGSGGEPGEDGDVLLFYQGDGFCHQVTTSHCHHNVAWCLFFVFVFNRINDAIWYSAKAFAIR